MLSLQGCPVKAFLGHGVGFFIVQEYEVYACHPEIHLVGQRVVFGVLGHAPRREQVVVGLGVVAAGCREHVCGAAEPSGGLTLLKGREIVRVEVLQGCETHYCTVGVALGEVLVAISGYFGHVSVAEAVILVAGRLATNIRCHCQQSHCQHQQYMAEGENP